MIWGPYYLLYKKRLMVRVEHRQPKLPVHAGDCGKAGRENRDMEFPDTMTCNGTYDAVILE